MQHATIASTWKFWVDGCEAVSLAVFCMGVVSKSLCKGRMYIRACPTSPFKLSGVWPPDGGCSLDRDLELGRHRSNSYPPAFSNFVYTSKIFWWSCCAEAFRPIWMRSSPSPADLSSYFSCFPGTCPVNLDAKQRKLWFHNCTRAGRLYGWWPAIGSRACLVGMRNALRCSSSILHREARHDLWVSLILLLKDCPPTLYHHN